MSAVVCRIAHVVGSNVHVVLDNSMEAVLGMAQSYEEAASIAQEIEIRNQNFDFEIVWALYPRKMGKKSGIIWLKRHVRSQSRYDLVLEAVKNYAEYCRDRGTEEQFILHFSTWVKKFEDWISENNPNIVVKNRQKGVPELRAFDVERLLLREPSKKLV